MLFLVRIRANFPEGFDQGERARISLAEAERGTALVQAGSIQGIWRIPGTSDNVGIWQCEDPDELHDLVASLPAYPWLTVTAEALASHPLTGLRTFARTNGVT